MKKIKLYNYWYNIKYNDGSIRPVKIVATNYSESKEFVDRIKDDGIYRRLYLERTNVKIRDYKSSYEQYRLMLEGNYV